MAEESANKSGERQLEIVHMPAPTAWPIVLAFGSALLFAGMVTTGAVSLLGAVLMIAATVGWFRDVLPHEAHEAVQVEILAEEAVTVRREVAHAHITMEMKRAFLPLETHPVSAGIKGGLAGSVAMAILAMSYGIFTQNGIWYPINLLAAGFLPSSMTETTAQLSAFHPTVLLIAGAIHLITSLLVGLLYGAMLPMLPRQPILLGGFIAPLIWSGLLYEILGIVNPVLDQRINWVWFVISQLGFGIVAGIVVSRTQKVRTSQPMPFALRLGMESPGLMEEKEKFEEDETP